MSRTPGNSDDDADVSIGVESSGPTNPLIDEAAGAPFEIPSAAADSALFARDAQAAGDAGEGRRADALICARALLAERQGDDQNAVALWRSGFDRDPTLLVAFWGLRRLLLRAHAWEELLGVLGRRIAAVFVPDRRAIRADLWLEHGRVLEDRLSRDEEAAHSYRSGLIEVPDHAGLLLSLLLLGWRRADGVLIAEALVGLLRRPLSPALRASLAVVLARLDRVGPASPVAELGEGTEKEAMRVPVEPVAAARALETLRAALGQVGPGEARVLLNELALLKRATVDPATRAEILDQMVSPFPDAGTRPGTGRLSGPDADADADADARAGADADAEMAVALLRERARLLRDPLDDQAGAERALYDALARLPRHPIVIADLADLAEATAVGGSPNEAVARLETLCGRALPAVGRFETDGQRELALRTVAALARAGRWSEGLALLDRHPDLDRDRADVFALEMILRAAGGDTAGLAMTFERCGELLARRAHDPPASGRTDAAAQMLVVAGALRECAGDLISGDDGTKAETNYRRARDIAPTYRPAREAMERRLWDAGRDRELAELWAEELGQLHADHADAGGALPARRARLLEELVALHRDRLDDPVTASRYQDELLATASADARAWVRRFDLELASFAHGGRSSEGNIRIARELALRADTPEVQAALQIEAARAAAANGDSESAEELFTKSLPHDRSGAASSGLERLADCTSAADVVRAELVVSQADRDAGTPAGAARLRALRFRIAWHARNDQRPREALEVLAPLCAGGDELAWSWSWEIARRSADPSLRGGVLRNAPESARSAMLRLSCDLGEALENAGDLAGAEREYRFALTGEGSTDAALGLLRVGSVQGNVAVVLESLSHLLASADQATAPLLAQEAAMLALLNGETPAEGGVVSTPGQVAGRAEDKVGVVLRWAAGVRSGDVLGAAAGLLAVARAVPNTNTEDAAADRNGLLARAAARARFGGPALAGAVHDQVYGLSGGAAPIGIGLSDLPVAGRPERAAARVARAERNGGRLAVGLDLERALDAEARGSAAFALDGFACAVSRDPENIEALDGIKRLALATGDRLGAARAGMRLGAVLRASARAAAEFGMAGQLFEDLAMTPEGAVAYWQALTRDPGSGWLFERLRALLGARGDDAGLERLYGHRLSVIAEPAARTALLFERARHRLIRLSYRTAAIEDFKRILKIDPDHSGALRELATLASQMELFPQACRFLDRLLGRVADERRAASIRIELGDAYESSRDLIRAVETFRAAAAAQPKDAAPWQRLTDLFLRGGDWRSALGSLGRWEAVVADPVRKAELWVRMGWLLRDHGRDGVAAAAAFVTAADLDPLGEGIRELIALHASSGAIAARRDALERAIAGLRRALAAEPLDVPRLRRLRELVQVSESSGAADVVGQILALFGETVEVSPQRQGLPRVPFGAAFWSRLAHPGSLGFAAEIWPTLTAAATELFPTDVAKPSSRERIPHGSEPRLAWVEAAAAAVGLPDLELFLSRAGDGGGSSIALLDAREPALVLGAGVLSGSAASRFRVGRALGLLRDRAVVFERITAAELQRLFAAAAVIAGAPPPVVEDGAEGPETQARLLVKALSRRDRKALELEASRFGFESIDAALFRESVLANADRLGLVLVGDVRVAVRVAGNFDDDAPPTAIVSHPRALDLIRFALHEDYLALRRECDEGKG